MNSSMNWRKIAVGAVVGLALATLITTGFAVAPNGMAWAAGMLQMPGTGEMAEPGPMHGGGMHGMMGTMHQQMHGGQEMPAECQAMMQGKGMMHGMTAGMMGMMHGMTDGMMHEPGDMDPAECQRRMIERGVSADIQAMCLQHMQAAVTDAGVEPQPE